MSGHRDSVSWVSPGWTSIAQLAVNAVFMIAAPFLPSRQLVCAVELMMLGLSGQLLTAYLEGRRAGVVFATLLGVSATKEVRSVRITLGRGSSRSEPGTTSLSSDSDGEGDRI